MVTRRIKAVESFQSLALNKEVDALAKVYLKVVQPPEHAITDAYHLAIAAFYGIDYLISWNCTHIANGHIIKQLQKINVSSNIQTPVICTPEELMEG